MRQIAVGFLLLFIFLFGVTLLRGSPSTWLQTDMQLLLPESARNDPLEKQIMDRLQRQSDTQILVLLAAGNREETKNAAAILVHDWRMSGLFRDVGFRALPDLDRLRHSARTLGAYLLSESSRRELITHPESYFRARAMDLSNPFIRSILPLSEDLLGFSRFYHPPTVGNFQADLSDGSLYLERNGKYWLFLRAQLAQSATVLGNDKRLLQLLQTSQRTLAEQSITLHLASSALINIASSREGAREGKWMSVLGIGLTIALFALVFRRWRCLWLLLPVAMGLIGGLTMVVAIFGGVHVMTLVIASSLVGLLLDLPLHWLGKSFFSHWREDSAMRALRQPFLVSTAITLLGYAMLLFTPLPVLRQTAVFSLTALTIAVIFAFWALPPLFRGFTPENEGRMVMWLQGVETGVNYLYRQLKQPFPIIVLSGVLIAGWIQCDWRDDIRDWVHVAQKQWADFTTFAEISGVYPERTVILLRAETPAALLEKDKNIASYLAHAKVQGVLADYQNLGQFLISEKNQQKTRAALRRIRENPESMTPLLETGLSREALVKALNTEIAQDNISFDEALATTFGAPWRALYPGKLGQEYFAVVRLFGIRDLSALRAGIAGVSDAVLRAPRQEINHAFDDTRWLALALKFVSYPLAFFLLAGCFGSKRAIAMLSVPLGAAAVTLALIGWIGKTVSVFAVFALLLVMAIGIDYAVYALAGRGERLAKLSGIVLACMTTLITFGILGFSATPAVSTFGLCIAIGVFFSALFACFFMIAGNIAGSGS